VTIVVLDLTIKLNKKKWAEPIVRLKKQSDKPRKLLDKSSIMRSKLVTVVLVQLVSSENTGCTIMEANLSSNLKIYVIHTV
jgi:hypothetical protein